jgi:ADP-ribose pyrophosphatase YjhB (NUDIX family)
MNDYYEKTDISILKKKIKIYCSNCGKHGHHYKRCKEHITSLGIINIKFVDKESTLIEHKLLECKDPVNIINTNNNNMNIILNDALKYKHSLKFLLVRRKHTLSYIEFIRGRYDIEDICQIISLFELMSPEELYNIKSNSFKELWVLLWKSNSNNRLYDKEYKISKDKFKYIINSPNIRPLLNKVETLFLCPEWGFPKGRRNKGECNLDCAIREFTEETSLSNNKYNIISNVLPINEISLGTNGINYKHIYYLAIDKTTDDSISINKNNLNQTNEIGDIGWFTYDEAINLIRPYYIEKKKIINELYHFMVNIINNCEK